MLTTLRIGSRQVLLPAVQAHRLLQKAITQNPKDYHALYELACDYWKADQRTEAVSARDGEKAESFFLQAKQYATAAQDNQYISLIDNYLEKINEWKKNIQTINAK